MNLLYKDNKKNEQIKDIISKLRGRNLNWKHLTNDECCVDIMSWFDTSYNMANKIVWIVRGDCARQTEICEKYGKEYAMYTAV